MTREKAVTVLKGLMKNPLFSEVHKVAFNIAIHDIKQRHDWDINNLILINKENYAPQTFKWCTDCKEYDQEKHCCHRWSKVIRDTVEEMKQEQEPKTGHWIEHPHEAGLCWEFSRYECSECHDWAEDDSNFCPNCGAFCGGDNECKEVIQQKINALKADRNEGNE